LITFRNAKPGIEKTVKEYLFDYRLMKANVDANIALGISTEIADIFKSRGGLVGRMKRNQATGTDVVKGYEEDAIKAFTSAAMGLAGTTAKGEMARKLINIQTGRTQSWEEFQLSSQDIHPDYKEYLDECKKNRIDPAVSPEAYRDLNEYTKDMLRNPEQLDRIMYNGRDPMSRKLADWWDEHKAEDAKRLEIERGVLKTAKGAKAFFLKHSKRDFDLNLREFSQLSGLWYDDEASVNWYTLTDGVLVISRSDGVEVWEGKKL
jgi:hypothetical protein